MNGKQKFVCAVQHRRSVSVRRVPGSHAGCEEARSGHVWVSRRARSLYTGGLGHQARMKQRAARAWVRGCACAVQSPRSVLPRAQGACVRQNVVYIQTNGEQRTAWSSSKGQSCHPGHWVPLHATCRRPPQAAAPPRAAAALRAAAQCASRQSSAAGKLIKWAGSAAADGALLL